MNPLYQDLRCADVIMPPIIIGIAGVGKASDKYHNENSSQRNGIAARHAGAVEDPPAQFRWLRP